MATHDAPVPTGPRLSADHASPSSPAEAGPPSGPEYPVPDPPPGERVVVYIEAELAELIDEYLGNRRADALALPVELAAGDYPSLRRRGHNLKGDGAAYGFDYLTDLGAALEAAAIRRDADAVHRCAVALTDYLTRLDVRPEDA